MSSPQATPNTLTAETLERVKKVLRTSLNQAEGTPMADDMPLVGGEFDLDSLDILLIVTNIEKEFAIKIREGQMDKSAFASVRTLASYAHAQRELQSQQGAA